MRPAYDYVIIGAGSAGCVLASRLSEKPEISVLLVESGPEDRNMFLTMPVGVGKLMQTEAARDYLSFFQISPGAGRAPDFWLKGKTIGGSSSINGMVYMRGIPSDYDRWEAQGCEGWGWSTIGRCYREMEDHALGAQEWRGVGGPLRVSMSQLNALGKATLKAAVQAGTPEVDDVNGVQAAMGGGVGPQPATIFRGRRFSAARAFLDVARLRRNLDVVTQTEAVGLTFDGLRASGVELQGQEGRREVSALREVILCTGGLNSPKLLQLAGIGPAQLLRSRGVAVRSNSPQVGRNLQDHRTVKVEYRVQRGSRTRQLRGLGLGLSALKYLLSGRGALSTCIWEVGGLIKTNPELDEPDCQIGATLFAHGADGLSRDPAIGLYGYVLRPESRGEVRIVSADPATPPEISANFLSTDYDREHTVSLFRHLRRIASRPALADYVLEELNPGAAVTSDDALVEASFDQHACAMHASGTCSMGSEPTSVVDPDLRVRGVDRLRVVDTSVMPRLVSGNTNGPVMALAWHASERILRASA